MVSRDSYFGKDPIEVKSTSLLIDELFTARMKLKAFVQLEKPTAEIAERIDRLERVIKGRIDHVMLTINGQKSFNYLTSRLAAVLQECWDAQEVVRDWKNQKMEDLANAGIQAQITNARRNELMREIDDLLGERNIKPLEKTYAQS